MIRNKTNEQMGKRHRERQAKKQILNYGEHTDGFQRERVGVGCEKE